MLHQTFLAIVIFYQFALALRDHLITGILAKGLPPDGKFHAYCIITTLEVTVVAVSLSLYEPLGLISILKAVTVYLTWFGGGLDWIYFIAKGEIPEWNFVWHWMPAIALKISRGRITFEHPTTKSWAIWTGICWVPTIICWAITLT